MISEPASVSPQMFSVSQPESGSIRSVVEGNVIRSWALPVPQNHSEAVLVEIRELRAALARRIQTAVIPITTLAPEPYQILRDIPAVVESAGDGFNATFFDANISTAGDTQEEAVSNLRSLVMDIFEYLESEAPEALGPEPTRQLGVLRVFLKRI